MAAAALAEEADIAEEAVVDHAGLLEAAAGDLKLAARALAALVMARPSQLAKSAALIATVQLSLRLSRLPA